MTSCAGGVSTPPSRRHHLKRCGTKMSIFGPPRLRVNCFGTPQKIVLFADLPSGGGRKRAFFYARRGTQTPKSGVTFWGGSGGGSSSMLTIGIFGTPCDTFFRQKKGSPGDRFVGKRSIQRRGLRTPPPRGGSRPPLDPPRGGVPPPGGGRKCPPDPPGDPPWGGLGGPGPPRGGSQKRPFLVFKKRVF